MIPATPHVARMEAYCLADPVAPPGKRLISLCQNESLRGPSPRALKPAPAAQHRYPDPGWTDLRHALAERHGIDPANILCGNGSLDLIGCLARAYLAPGTTALAPRHAYPFFRTATLSTGADFVTAPERDDLTVDVDALIAATTAQTRIVFVANPGNPTGTRLPASELRRLRRGLPDDVLLVIDEAYGEFADHLAEPVFNLVGLGNTAVLRTFSKAYGLAGARVGWGLFPPAITHEIRKVINPNNISTTSQAMAIAALRDHDYMQETCALTAQIRAAFHARISALGFDLPISHTNFSLIRFPSPDAAQRADQFLRAEGVFLRPQGGAGLPDCLRATIGAADDMTRVAALLEVWSRKGETT